MFLPFTKACSPILDAQYNSHVQSGRDEPWICLHEGIQSTLHCVNCSEFNNYYLKIKTDNLHVSSEACCSAVIIYVWNKCKAGENI